LEESTSEGGREGEREREICGAKSPGIPRHTRGCSAKEEE